MSSWLTILKPFEMMFLKFSNRSDIKSSEKQGLGCGVHKVDGFQMQIGVCHIARSNPYTLSDEIQELDFSGCCGAGQMVCHVSIGIWKSFTVPKSSQIVRKTSSEKQGLGCGVQKVPLNLSNNLKYYFKVINDIHCNSIVWNNISNWWWICIWKCV